MNFTLESWYAIGSMCTNDRQDVYQHTGNVTNHRTCCITYMYKESDQSVDEVIRAIGL